MLPSSGGSSKAGQTLTRQNMKWLPTTCLIHTHLLFEKKWCSTTKQLLKGCVKEKIFMNCTYEWLTTWLFWCLVIFYSLSTPYTLSAFHSFFSAGIRKEISQLIIHCLLWKSSSTLKALACSASKTRNLDVLVASPCHHFLQSLSLQNHWTIIRTAVRENLRKLSAMVKVRALPNDSWKRNAVSNHNRNLQISRAPLKSQAQRTSLFMSTDSGVRKFWRLCYTSAD